jgi:CDP-diacylglycerol--glycerol-3-phosphate 3-phosphatidyltransferase
MKSEGVLDSNSLAKVNLFTLANYLTFIRIFISPIFLLVYIQHDFFQITASMLPYVLLFLIGASELSDALDGAIARRYQQVTDFGKLLDPMADSISRISVFLTFTQPPVNLPLLLVFVFLYRDSVISTLRMICALKGFALAARASGKLKAIIQAVVIISIVIMMIPHSLGYLSTTTLQTTSAILVTFSAFYALYSGAEYIYANRGYIWKILSQ